MKTSCSIFPLNFIVELVAVVLEKFDPVVLVGIVRGGENNASVGAERTRDVGHAWGRERADQEDIHAQRRDPGDERILQHVAGEAGVFPQHDFRPQSWRVRLRIESSENVRRGAPEFEGGLGCDRLDVGHPAHAVRSKYFLCFRHSGCPPLFFCRS